jgi:hypothetical protein
MAIWSWSALLGAHCLVAGSALPVALNTAAPLPDRDVSLVPITALGVVLFLAGHVLPAPWLIAALWQRSRDHATT